MVLTETSSKLLRLSALAAIVAVAPTDSMALPMYRLVDIGDLAGGLDYSGATTLNNAHQVVGESHSAAGAPGAFQWESGKMVGLGPLPDGTSTWTANSINSLGQIVGGGGNRGYLFDGAASIELGDLPGGIVSNTPYDINDLGQVVGSSSAANGNRGFIWQNGVMTDLGDLPGGADFSNAFGINNLGQVVGHSGTVSGGRAFLWQNGAMVDLGDLPGGGDGSIAFDLNESTQVVGFGQAATGGRAFLWENGSMTDLGDLPGGDDYSLAYDINELGQVVGFSRVLGGTHGFLWEAGSLFDLNSLILSDDPLKPFVTVLEAQSINDHGSIAAYGFDSRTGANHAYLLTPVKVPEPRTLALLLIAISCVSVVRHLAAAAALASSRQRFA